MDNNTTQYMLTTVDNPWNPWTHWDEWYAFDQGKGYDTPGLLARISALSFNQSDADQELVIQQAIQEIVNNDFFHNYRKISKDDLLNVA